MESDQLKAIYRHRFTAEETARMTAVWRVLVREYFSRWIDPKDAVLDYGAGQCAFINQVVAGERVACDANPDTKAHCASGVAFVSDAELGDPAYRERFDVVFVSNLLEHLPGPDAVLATLKMLREVLKANGRLLVLQPNFALVGARYFDFIDHRTILTDRSLVEAFELSGYRVDFLKRRFLP